MGETSASAGERPDNRQPRQGLICLVVCLAGPVCIYGLYDTFRPIWAPSFVHLIFSAFYVLPVLAVASCVLHLARNRIDRRATKSRHEQIQTWLNGTMLFFECLTCCQGLIYDPIKFAILAHRIETAATVEEERSAFRLASRLGDVWEVNPVFPNDEWPPQWTEKIERIEIEWLETAAWTSRPFRAQRTLLDRRNLDLLYQ